MKRSRSRKAALAVTVLALAATALVGPALTEGGTTARALTAPVAMTADDLPTWQTNGVVWAMAQSDGVVFAGGTFSAIRPPGAGPGTSERQAVNFAAFDAATGAPTDCRLNFTVGSGTATVRALDVSPDGKTLYAGGNFAAVNGTHVSRVAAVDIATCKVKPDFSVSVSSTVHALAATDDTVYLGGDFTSVEGQSRSKFAALSTSGALRSWKADADLTGRALAVTPDGKSVVLGGDFTRVRGSSSRALAVVDASSGAIKRAYGSTFVPRNSVVKSLYADETGIYTANEGTGGGVFDGRIALNLDDFSQRWRDTCLGATQDVTVYKGVLYSSSHAHNCSSMGQFGELHERQHLLAESVDDPTPLLSWFPDTDDGPLNVEQVGPRVMVASSSGGRDYMWVGGAFSRIASNGNKPQQGLVRFANGPDTRDPTVPTGVNAANVTTGVRVTWPAATDLDDRALTYRVYRNGAAEPVGTVRANSTFWDRPTVGFTDTTVKPGTDYTYRITASDADDANTSARSEGATVHTPGTATETTLEREATADAYVNGSSVNSTYGTHQQLAVRGSSPYETYVRFNVPSPPSGMVLEDAKLTVTTSADSYAPTADTVSVRAVTGSWSESTVTYAERPALGTTTLGSLNGAAERSTAYDIPLSTGAVGDAAGDSLDLALTSTGSDSMWLLARESGGTGPKLTLTYRKP
ncbi:fibronectin type III domain-containing protein [Streptomyces oryzae]|uniref:Fibronectin type III domain-containing protein n=1 Tax=Streptomyces oryzae TaxID=1434886 RepID=A0ABS3XI65_9ACTN|nr:DNRLRE domain-containing protein [Streptomyces oryzae]MBO8195023.1 fibronectin type III domain-containing protein [Streptomyces oryzae]